MTAVPTSVTRLPAADGASAALAADAAVAAWTSVFDALSPVVGARGAWALYRRVLFLCAAPHPWLLPVYQGAADPGNFTALRLAMIDQEPARIVLAQQDMMAALHELLARLIGAPLTQRLLPISQPPHSAGDAVQDPSP